MQMPISVEPFNHHVVYDDVDVEHLKREEKRVAAGREEAYRCSIGVGCCNAMTGLSAVLLGDHFPPPSRTVLDGVVGAAGAGGQGCLLLLVDPRHGSY
ncbi:hypothetical protein BHE74_00044785 [Ensete ventricosum]|nr:hypothetical protein GW17_00036631 [Ensete ventricosum]RWW49090.1 hypothetical protein BHE74_00044785 [Ensete ventricosum]